jgi:hypothetical protein
MVYRRREPRFQIDQPVTVKDLEKPQILLSGRLVNFSAQGSCIMLDRALRPGTMVRVEWGGTVLLGEIVYCWPSGPEYAAGLRLEDALYEREETAALAANWTLRSRGER